MILKRAHWGCLTGGLAAIAALATGGMATAPADQPVRMSGLQVEGLPGLVVVDRAGAKVGETIGIVAGRNGQARWIDIALDAGGEVRVASFRAFFDQRRKQIAVSLSEDLLLSRADAAEAQATILPSA